MANSHRPLLQRVPLPPPFIPVAPPAPGLFTGGLPQAFPRRPILYRPLPVCLLPKISRRSIPQTNPIVSSLGHALLESGLTHQTWVAISPSPAGRAKLAFQPRRPPQHRLSLRLPPEVIQCNTPKFCLSKGVFSVREPPNTVRFCPPHNISNPHLRLCSSRVNDAR